MNPPSQDGNMEDFSWNAVWESAAVITDSGWGFEMFISFFCHSFWLKKMYRTGA